MRSIKGVNVAGKKVLLRADLDGPIKRLSGGRGWESIDEGGLEDILPTLRLLRKNGAKTIVIGHLGRPEGKVVEKLRLDPVVKKLGEYLKNIHKVDDCLGPKVETAVEQMRKGDILFLENLRFYPEEKANDPDFAKKLALLADIYVNECFAASHRQHASIVSLPKHLPSCAGLRFAQEIKILSRVLKNPKRPLVVVVGGAKESKFKLIPRFLKIADLVLIGGYLLKRFPDTHELVDGKTIFACLTKNGEDITMESAKYLTGFIGLGGTVIWSGPMGVYEDERDIGGTKIVAEAIANSSAFKIVGGGDTEAAINILGLKEKFDWISTGGGAMLEFLAKGTLPGLKALAKNKR